MLLHTVLTRYRYSFSHLHTSFSQFHCKITEYLFKRSMKNDHGHSFTSYAYNQAHSVASFLTTFSPPKSRSLASGGGPVNCTLSEAVITYYTNSESETYYEPGSCPVTCGMGMRYYFQVVLEPASCGGGCAATTQCSVTVEITLFPTTHLKYYRLSNLC